LSTLACYCGLTDNKYSKNYLRGDDQKFKDKFCDAYQVMSMIGMQVPDDVKQVSKKLIIA